MATPLTLDASLVRPPRRQIPSSICSNWTNANGLLGGPETARWSPGRNSSQRTRIRAPIRALTGEEKIPALSVRIVAVVGAESVSPLKNAPWEQVMLHTANRLKWVDEGFEMLVFSDKSIHSNGTTCENLRKELVRSDMLVNVAIKSQQSVEWLQTNSASIPNVICFESSPSMRNKLGGTYARTEGEENIFSKLANNAKSKKKKRVLRGC